MANSLQPAPATPGADQVPRTFDQALDPAWLTHALAPVTGGAAVTDVRVVEVLRTMATKVRFTASWDGPGGGGAFCLKAFLDVDAESARGAAVTITEADFYAEIAPNLPVRLPSCIAHIVDRAGGQGVIIMRDLIADGARFCTALEPLDPSQAAASLDQLARLHAHSACLERAPWIGHRVSDFANAQFLPQATLQNLLDGPRGVGLEPGVRDAGRLIAGLKALAARDKGLPQTLIHGDCHAGNLFQTPGGPGLIDWQLLQHGGWALDVAYHIAAVLPVAVAEREEWNLLLDYLDRARGYGCETPDFEAAREEYRAATVWGYYLWAITRRVEPAVIETFVNRLGSALTRHESYRLLNV
jgi:aminoglycoside phosphotransferase (APT) family kinase protein